MLRCALVLALLAACAADDNWPCPTPDTILPCICQADAQRELTMDCSEVQTSDALAKVFQTHFSFNDFKQLTINPTNSSKSLQDLPAGVFGSVSFQNIDISNTRIHTVEEQALVNSHSTLMNLNLPNNEISVFPFETLKLFTALVDFNIENNKLSGPCPDIESATLITIKLSTNTGWRIAETTFVNAPYLEEIFLNNMQLEDSMPADVFKTLKYLRILHLNNNKIPGELIEHLINPELRPLTTLTLSNNQITQLHYNAISGLKESAYVDLKNNNIEYLYEGNWDTLVAQLINEEAIDIRNNPLVCGCDVMWLVSEPDFMRLFHNGTTCAAGNTLVSLDLQWFLDHCQ